MRDVALKLDFAIAQAIAKKDPQFVLKAELVIDIDRTASDGFCELFNVPTKFHWELTPELSRAAERRRLE